MCTVLFLSPPDFSSIFISHFLSPVFGLPSCLLNGSLQRLFGAKCTPKPKSPLNKSNKNPFFFIQKKLQSFAFYFISFRPHNFQVDCFRNEYSRTLTRHILEKVRSIHSFVADALSLYL